MLRGPVTLGGRTWRPGACRARIATGTYIVLLVRQPGVLVRLHPAGKMPERPVRDAQCTVHDAARLGVLAFRRATYASISVTGIRRWFGPISVLPSSPDRISAYRRVRLHESSTLGHRRVGLGAVQDLVMAAVRERLLGVVSRIHCASSVGRTRRKRPRPGLRAGPRASAPVK